MSPLWRIEMFGAYRATSEGASICRFRTRRVGLLLAFLACHRGQSFSRSEVADMLWPEYGEEQARINLRQALASLRRHVEPPPVPHGAVLMTEQGRISVSSSLVETDAAEFVAAIELSDRDPARRIELLTHALALYKGDLLPGYFEDWVLAERLRMEDMFVAASDRLIRTLEEEGRLDRAVPHIHAALAKDNLREDLHFCLIRAYAAAGSPTRALRHFKEWEQLARRELGREPDRELRQFVRHLPSQTEAMISRRHTPVKTLHRRRPTAGAEKQVTISRLPIQLTRFFGRSQERETAVSRLESKEVRLMTLFGPAGGGKTRLSIEIGRELSDHHGWNVWFVPLADISDGSMVLDSLLSAMRVPRDASSPPLEQLRSSLPGTKNLLVFDNLEHIIESGAPVVASLLAEVPGVACLVTSRQSLGLLGEHVVDLRPLSIDECLSRRDASQPCSSEELAEFASTPCIQLFADRSQAVLPDFQLTFRNAGSIAAICAKLDGLPLAIEIAAGLSSAFTPAQLLTNLGARLEILRNRFRDVSPRHRSLWAAISYSYGLLTPELQRFFAELSVFRGGFTVAAAGKICQIPKTPGGAGHPSSCLQAILDLQERSLLRAEESGERAEPRFRLLESFREFGKEQLSAQENEALRMRHASFYYELAVPFLAPRVRPPPNNDRDNWLEALQTYREHGLVHECVSLLVGLRSYSAIERETIMELAAQPEAQSLAPIEQVWLLLLQSRCFTFWMRFEEALSCGLKTLPIAERSGDHEVLSMSHTTICNALNDLGRFEETLAHAKQTIQHGKAAGNLLVVEIGHINCGTAHWSMGNLEQAIEGFRGALSVSIELNRGKPSWLILHNLARSHLDLGKLDESLEYASESLRLAQAIEDAHGVALSLSMIARYHLLAGNLVAALATSHESLCKQQRGYLYWLYNGIQLHARILLRMGDHAEGTSLLAASRLVARFGRKTDDEEFAESLAFAKEQLSETAFERAWAAGVAMSLEEAINLAAEFR